MKQGTYLKAKADFTMRIHGSKGRPVSVKVGELFAVTSPDYQNSDIIMVDRKSKAKIGSGYPFSACLILDYFEVLA